MFGSDKVLPRVLLHKSFVPEIEILGMSEHSVRGDNNHRYQD